MPEKCVFVPGEGKPYRILVTNHASDQVTAFAFDAERSSLVFTGVVADGMSFPHGLGVSADGTPISQSPTMSTIRCGFFVCGPPPPPSARPPSRRPRARGFPRPAGSADRSHSAAARRPQAQTALVRAGGRCNPLPGRDPDGPPTRRDARAPDAAWAGHGAARLGGIAPCPERAIAGRRQGRDRRQARIPLTA